MQVYQGAKQLKLTNKELIELIGVPEVDHHMDRIPDEMLEDLGLVEKKIETPEPEPTKTVDSAKTDVVEVKVVEKKAEPCPYTVPEIKLGIKLLGSKAPQWKWRKLIG